MRPSLLVGCTIALWTATPLAAQRTDPGYVEVEARPGSQLIPGSLAARQALFRLDAQRSMSPTLRYDCSEDRQHRVMVFAGVGGALAGAGMVFLAYGLWGGSAPWEDLALGAAVGAPLGVGMGALYCVLVRQEMDA